MHHRLKSFEISFNKILKYKQIFLFIDLKLNTNEANMLKSYLLLQDGILFEGKSFGAQTHSDGEIGFF